ncbi:class F sortase [Actinokineospora sp. HBU206404]|uniref:Class F sortase n=1 Tax=Actinokineospora xionganensis TaxID=2684470 RepID=A0ABR7L8B1_9PSEU|nr:class F sortase [Actinokineospora xionganensis]
MVALILLSGCATAVSTPSITSSSESSAPPPASQSTTAAARIKPVSVEIPKIRAKSSLVPVGLAADGTLEVPPTSQPLQAAWYELGPMPGEVGPSVVLGHVDGDGKPGIFHQLTKLAPGDEVLIAREDGSTVTFVVRRLQQVAKDAFPTEEVYGDTAGPELRLITCGGSFDRATGNYRDNVIAYATPKSG